MQNHSVQNSIKQHNSGSEADYNSAQQKRIVTPIRRAAPTAPDNQTATNVPSANPVRVTPQTSVSVAVPIDAIEKKIQKLETEHKKQQQEIQAKLKEYRLLEK